MRYVLCLFAFFAVAVGCIDQEPFVLPLVADVATDDYEVEQKPSRPTFAGWRPLVEPCEFHFDLRSSDPDGFVAGFRQIRGEMPPGCIMSLAKIDASTQDVVGRIRGPAVDAGRWSAYFVAVDDDGHESLTREVPFVCVEN